MEYISLSDKRKLFFYLEEEFKSSLAKTLISVERYKYNCSLILLAVDDLKNYSEPIKKNILNNISDLILNHTRLIDMPFLIDNERFMIILSHTNKRGALSLAERLRMYVSRTEILCHGKKNFFTVSGSIVSLLEDHLLDELILMKSLEKALFLARDKGGNYIYPYSPKILSIDNDN